MVGSTTYMSTTYSPYERCYALTYASPSSGYTSRSIYIDNYYGSPTGFDIGYQYVDGAGDIWMATDNETSPISCYKVTSGNIVRSLEANIGIGSDIRGVTFEESSGTYLWVSNVTYDEIYRIDISETGIGCSASSETELPEISVGHNPFYSMLDIDLAGFEGHVTLDIYDLQGRKLHSAEIENSYTWHDTAIPSGFFILKVSDDSGHSVTECVVKL